MITVVANLKGGVGKSTISFHLVAWLLQYHLRVKAIDLDPQKTLTDIVEIREEEGITPLMNLSNMSLMNSKLDLNQYDEVVVDVGAQSMVELKFALVKADKIIVPVTPSQADIWATQRFVKLVCALRRADSFPELLAVVNNGDIDLSNYDTQDTYEVLGMIDGLQVIDTIIYNNEDFRSALYEGMACFEFNPDGQAAREFTQVAKAVYGDWPIQ